VTYWNLLRHAALLIGNSSSGIMEAASFALPVVNVGFRQKGRERARNVLDAEPETNAILARIDEGMSSEFRASLAGMANPYGDGHAAEKIVQVLTSTPLSGELLVKHAPAIGA
jgi:UDP-N-acetylglucosamine 2-epimerase (non-hydrolysing)/GDP/UDP-N,N'-diacetylbacillosamine 2-epimerase (hydrolysing)